MLRRKNTTIVETMFSSSETSDHRPLTGALLLDEPAGQDLELRNGRGHTGT